MDVLPVPFSKRGARRAARPEIMTCTALRPQTKTATRQAQSRWFLWLIWQAPKPPKEHRNNEERPFKHAQKKHFAARTRRPWGGGPPPKHQNERRRSHAQTQPRRKQRHRRHSHGENNGARTRARKDTDTDAEKDMARTPANTNADARQCGGMYTAMIQIVSGKAKGKPT